MTEIKTFRNIFAFLTDSAYKIYIVQGYLHFVINLQKKYFAKNLCQRKETNVNAMTQHEDRDMQSRQRCPRSTK